MRKLLKFTILITVVFLFGCECSRLKCGFQSSPTAFVKAFDSGYEIYGINVEKRDIPATVDGCEKGVKAFVSTANAPLVQGVLDTAITDSGAVSFWLKSDKHFRSSFDKQTLSQPIFSIDGLNEAVFHGKDPANHCPSVRLKWDKSIADVHDLWILLPEIPKDIWLHVIFTWDSRQGLTEAYINGTPLKPTSDVPVWKSGQYDNITINSGVLPLADVRIFDHFITAPQARSLTKTAHLGTMDKYLGLTELGKISNDYIESLKGELHYSNSLAEPDDIDGWVMEGPGIISFEDGWLVMSSAGADDSKTLNGHIVNWCDVDMPENFVARWDYRMISEYGLTIMFFCAKATDGSDIFSPHLAPRNGVFSGYIIGDIDNYHISYQANGPGGGGRSTSHIRKNSGFALAANGPIGVPAGSTDEHKIVLIKNGDHIQMAVDGRLIIDFKEDGSLGKTHGSGKMGFRQMKWTKAAYRNFKVYEIE